MPNLLIRNVDKNYLNEIDRLSVEKGFKSRNEFLLDLIARAIEKNEIPDHSFKALSEQISKNNIQNLQGQKDMSDLIAKEIGLINLYLEENENGYL